MSNQDLQLLAPGPVQLHPEVRRILSLPMIHHRTPEFDQILQRVLTQLKMVFATQQPVFIHSSTGSGGMESLLVNTLSPGDEVLCVISGKFGERWAEMAKVYGLQTHILQIPWGEAAHPEQISEALSKNPKIAAVLTQACETSTGVLHPIQEIAAITRKSSALLLVDGITAVGALPILMDAWGIDGLVAGSQKAFMLPTGLSFICLSERAWEAQKKSKLPKYYFDLAREKKANSNNETFFSSSVALIRALDWVLEHVAKIGIDKLYFEIDRRAQMTRHYAHLAGLCSYALAPSPSLTALALPPNLDGQKLRLELELQHGITLMGGQDQLKGKILRVGHMGFIDDSEMLRLFEKLNIVLGLSLEKSTFINQEMQAWLKNHP